MPSGSEIVSRNLWKILALRFLGDFLPIAPVLILYYTANGLNSTQIFTIQAAFHLVVLLLEVPSGYLADVVGRRKTLILGAIFFPLGMGVYAVGRSFAAFVCAEAVLAVSISMRSGCDSALLFDSLRQLKREGEYKRYEGRNALFARTGTAVSSVAGGLLAAVFLRLPFLVNIGSALFMPPLTVALAEPEREKRRSHEPLRDILRICRFCLREPHIRPVVLFAGLIMACNLTGVWAYFLLYQGLGIGIGWFGVLFAAFQLAGALGGGWAHAFSERFGARAALLLALFSPLCFVLLGLFPSIWLLALVPANALLWNLAYPVLLERLNLAVGSDVRATVLSLASMAGSVMFIVISPLFGRLVNAFSLSAAFIALGALFLLAGAPLVAAILRHWREGQSI
ncbi:MAG: MFS transporter [Candidatus Aminicenantes bacterium]|nr:MFS transporter [Candidatus Aminicenantes bacterium]